MPPPNRLTLSLTANADIRPGSVIIVSDNTGQRFVGQVVNVGSGSSLTAEASVEPVPSSWVRAGQTAFRVSDPTDRIIIVGITETVHCRKWEESGENAILGDRVAANRETFESIWYPFYHSTMTRPGARFYSVQRQQVYEVVEQHRDTFAVRNVNDHSEQYALERMSTAPSLWLYMGQPTPDKPTTFHPISFTRKQGFPAAPSPPKTRFDRDDIV